MVFFDITEYDLSVCCGLACARRTHGKSVQQKGTRLVSWGHWGIEKIVKDKLKSDHFRTVEEVVSEALQALREKDQPSPTNIPNGAQREAVSEMLSFVQKNCVRLKGISVKDLIHEGHRL
jgi:hypothetical protein